LPGSQAHLGPSGQPEFTGGSAPKGFQGGGRQPELQGSTGSTVPRGPTGASRDVLSPVPSGQVGTVGSPGAHSSITIGDRFCSFTEVEARLAAFSKSTFTKLWMRDARTISAAAKRTPKRAAAVNPELKYYTVKYCCIHGGRTFQPEGQGHRRTS